MPARERPDVVTNTARASRQSRAFVSPIGQVASRPSDHARTLVVGNTRHPINGRGQIRFGVRWTATLLVVTSLSLAACSNDSPPEASALCSQVARQGELRQADRTDPKAIADLVKALPTRYKSDAALFYYPYGGSVAGLDTAGSEATAAGRRLYRLYETACHYRGE